jgi:hypothetical protein
MREISHDSRQSNPESPESEAAVLDIQVRRSNVQNIPGIYVIISGVISEVIMSVKYYVNVVRFSTVQIYG